MKSIFFSLLAVVLFHISGVAQTVNPEPNLKDESAAIEKTALNYVEGFYNGDPQRIAAAVSPELVKRIVAKDAAGNSMIQNMGASVLLSSARAGKKNDPDPSVPFKGTVTIYDIYNDTATVKIVTNKLKFIDYAQLAKIDGSWKIVNVLWALTK